MMIALSYKLEDLWYNYDINNDNDDRIQHHDKKRYYRRYPDITFNI